ncbi:MAG: DUF4416 family protein [Deltaproteobacteria bacterium]|nr:DUF4416 family protein [Deltaproteobacteria bacterium]
MSRPIDAEAVKLIMSVFSADNQLLNEALKDLHRLYGDPDFISSPIPFDYTSYYAAEMGLPLLRRYVSFENLVKPESLPDIKSATNELEDRYSINSRRTVNIDPGYLGHANLILATGKGYTHRPYLRDGIYADLTLIYQNGTFQSLSWTYPDYAAPETIAMFNKIRARYILQMKEQRKGHKE